LLRVVGTDQRKAPVGILRARGPDLLAIDEEVVTLVDALRAQRREVRAGARLGIALAPPHLAGDDSGHVLLLLLLAAILQQGRTEHHHAHAADRIPRPAPVHLLLQHARLLARQPAGAVLPGPGRRTPA